MAVVGARACLDLTLATRRLSGLATRTDKARAGRMSRGQLSRTCRDRTRLSPP